MICIFAGSLVEVHLLYADVEKQKPQLLCVWRIGGECCKEMCGRNLVERIGGKWSFSHIRSPNFLPWQNRGRNRGNFQTSPPLPIGHAFGLAAFLFCNLGLHASGIIFCLLSLLITEDRNIKMRHRCWAGGVTLQGRQR